MVNTIKLTLTYMKIILLRHGEPDIDTRIMLSPHQYADWLSLYNRASIKQPHLFNDELKQLVQQCGFVVCSDLARSIDSAKALNIENIDISDTLFREFEMPYTNWQWPRLSVANWTVLFRVMWLLGYSAKAESFKAARQRAELCLQRLTDYAGQNDTVLFVGHGSLHWYLARLLLKNGWQGPASSPRRYWDYGIYIF